MRNVALIFALILSVSCSKDDTIETVTTAELSPQEIADLSVLREEEKLARDVYLYAYDTYGLAIFNNISKSEQTHMDKVLSLLDAYGLEDSAHPDRGVFNKVELSELYESLTTKAALSLEDALQVGATIEDLDISDINEFLSRTQEPSIVVVYESLNCGSKNHIRSFNGQIESHGDTYAPQFISQDEFETILSQPSGGCGN